MLSQITAQKQSINNYNIHISKLYEMNIDNLEQDLLDTDFINNDNSNEKLIKQFGYVPIINVNYDYSIAENTYIFDEIIENVNILINNNDKLLILNYLINSTNDDGYIRINKNGQWINKEELYLCLSNEINYYLNFNLTSNDILNNIKYLQNLANSLGYKGLFSTTLQEFLLSQLDKNSIEYNIINNYYELFINRNWSSIKQKLNLINNEWDLILNKIKKLNCNFIFNNDVEYSKPTYVLTIDEDESLNLLNLNFHLPNILIHNDYHKLEVEITSKILIGFPHFKSVYSIKELKEKFINEYKIISYILDKQKNYFLSNGDIKYLNKVTVKELSIQFNISESLICRLLKNKIIDTPVGSYYIPFFLHKSKKNKITLNKLYDKLYQAIIHIIDNEDKNNPYTIDEICNILKLEGYLHFYKNIIDNIFIKMNIPSAIERKHYYISELIYELIENEKLDNNDKIYHSLINEKNIDISFEIFQKTIKNMNISNNSKIYSVLSDLIINQKIYDKSELLSKLKEFGIDIKLNALYYYINKFNLNDELDKISPNFIISNQLIDIINNEILVTYMDNELADMLNVSKRYIGELRKKLNISSYLDRANIKINPKIKEEVITLKHQNITYIVNYLSKKGYYHNRSSKILYALVSNIKKEIIN